MEKSKSGLTEVEAEESEVDEHGRQRAMAVFSPLLSRGELSCNTITPLNGPQSETIQMSTEASRFLTVDST
jgi:hypothetical protein